MRDAPFFPVGPHCSHTDAGPSIDGQKRVQKGPWVSAQGPAMQREECPGSCRERREGLPPATLEVAQVAHLPGTTYLGPPSAIKAGEGCCLSPLCSAWTGGGGFPFTKAALTVRLR